ncbi:MAG: hypothetical protein ACJA13_002998, partial [Paraglaciecola sp.]
MIKPDHAPYFNGHHRTRFVASQLTQKFISS